MEQKKGKFPIWPEWSEADINAEKWDTGKGGKEKDKTGKSPVFVSKLDCDWIPFGSLILLRNKICQHVNVSFFSTASSPVKRDPWFCPPSSDLELINKA